MCVSVCVCINRRVRRKKMRKHQKALAVQLGTEILKKFICMYIYSYMCTYIYIYVYKFMYMYINSYIYVYEFYICTNTVTFYCVYVHKFIYICIWILHMYKYSDLLLCSKYICTIINMFPPPTVARLAVLLHTVNIFLLHTYSKYILTIYIQ
jgi:hypothetical protein